MQSHLRKNALRAHYKHQSGAAILINNYFYCEKHETHECTV